MPVEEIQPHTDPRWAALVASHPHSSVFHKPEWLEALRRTYRYTPVAFILNPGGEPPSSGLVFCRVDSWLTGRRLVSLPFSDHCDPLVHDRTETRVLFSKAQEAGSGLKYLEFRPRMEPEVAPPDFRAHSRYCLHTLDLRPSLDTLYFRLHKNSMQRKIRRADREGLVLDQGRSDLLLQNFYALLLLTRRRHGLPPQPLAWFRNLIECYGDRLTIYVARVGTYPIASILTLRHKQTLVYKYGCSDGRFHPKGGMARLFWEAIQDAKRQRLLNLDLGRSEESHAGLIRFKDRLGAERTTLTYWRWSERERERLTRRPTSIFPTVSSRVLSGLPNGLFRRIGELFYRHVG